MKNKLPIFFVLFVFIFFTSLLGQTFKTEILKKADLIITEIEIRPNYPCANEIITFVALIKNIGSAESNDSIVGFIVGSREVATVPFPALGPGKSHGAVLRKMLPEIKNYRVTAFADFRKQVIEWNENNNTKYKDFKLLDKCCTDINLKSIYINPRTPKAGKFFLVYFSLKNESWRKSSPSKISIYFGGRTKPYYISIGSLEPWESRTINERALLNKPGKYRVKAIVDPKNKLKECNENNNIKYFDFTVSK